MMRILLVKLPEPVKPTQKKTYMPPFGLWSIQHAARGAGHTVHVVDLHLTEGFDTEALFSYCWDIIGLSAQFSIQHQWYTELAYQAKRSGAKVYAGGFHAAATAHHAPLGVDRVIAGGGEQIFSGRPLEDIDYPPPSAERLAPYWAKGSPHDLQSKTQRWTPIEFSRGCNRHCGFCGVNGFWGRVRYFGRDKIAGYLAALEAEGIEELFIEDDNCISDADTFRWIIQEIGKHGIWWSTPNGISARALRPFVPMLADSGCWRVSLPLETGTESTARLMRLGTKWMPRLEAAELVQDLRYSGIKTCGFFIIGYPGETLADMQKTLDYANSLPLDQRNIYIATPYPGTPLYDQCVEQGYIVSRAYDDLLYTRGLINTPDFTPEDVERLKAEDRERAIKGRTTC